MPESLQVLANLSASAHAGQPMHRPQLATRVGGQGDPTTLPEWRWSVCEDSDTNGRLGMHPDGRVSSGFTDVDASADPADLVCFLDSMATVMAATKSTLNQMLAIEPGQRILDLGCGAGHDLVAIADAGGAPLGVGRSVHMLRAAACRCPSARLVRADGAALPFADQTVDGCRIERVLVHVLDPMAVLAEVRRVLRPGARVVLFDPSTATLVVEGTGPATAAALHRGIRTRYRQPEAGTRAPNWLLINGFRQIQRRDELRRFHQLDRLTESMNIAAIWQHAVEIGAIATTDVTAWYEQMRQRSVDGVFAAAVWGTFATAIA